MEFSGCYVGHVLSQIMLPCHIDKGFCRHQACAGGLAGPCVKSVGLASSGGLYGTLEFHACEGCVGCGEKCCLSRGV